MKKSSFLIAGKHAVTEALKNPNRKVLNVLLTEDSKKKLNKDNKNLNLLEGVKLYYKNRRELDRLCSKEQISHQGLIAEIEHLEEINLKDYLNLVEKRIASSKQHTNNNKENSLSLEKSINKCTELGFTEGTEKHGDCVMKLYK